MTEWWDHALGPGFVEAFYARRWQPVSASDAAFDGDRGSDKRLDQIYTHPNIAADFYRIFQEHFNPMDLLMVEPSAGTGSFLRLLSPGSKAFDLEPKYPGIETADYLAFLTLSSRRVATVGNPPFGRNSSMAIRFFNHAARQSSIIAFILPRTFRKASTQNRLARSFHLLHERNVPANAFLFRGKPYDVPAVFQIWERRSEFRALRPTESKHPDFEFTIPERADFALQRVGTRAGRIHHDFTLSRSSHYFIKGDVEAIMANLDFASVAGNVAGNPSISKSEIVSLYLEATEPLATRPNLSTAKARTGRLQIPADTHFLWGQ